MYGNGTKTIQLSMKRQFQRYTSFFINIKTTYARKWLKILKLMPFWPLTNKYSRAEENIGIQEWLKVFALTG